MLLSFFPHEYTCKFSGYLVLFHVKLYQDYLIYIYTTFCIQFSIWYFFWQLFYVSILCMCSLYSTYLWVFIIHNLLTFMYFFIILLSIILPTYHFSLFIYFLRCVEYVWMSGYYFSIFYILTIVFVTRLIVLYLIK